LKKYPFPFPKGRLKPKYNNNNNNKEKGENRMEKIKGGKEKKKTNYTSPVLKPYV